MRLMINLCVANPRVASPRCGVMLASSCRRGIVRSPAAPTGRAFWKAMHRHSMVTSTVPANGDQNPYAIVVAPVSCREDPGRATCWSTISTTGTTCRVSAPPSSTTVPSTEAARPCSPRSRATAAMPGRRRADHGDDHAEIRLGHRRQPAEPGRHHGDQGPGLPDRARRRRATSPARSPARTSTGRGATWR